MTKFIATFSNGNSITRNSDHDYSYAWAIIRIADGMIIEGGFSSTLNGAIRNADNSMPKTISARDRKNPAMRKYHTKLAKQLNVTYDQWVASIDEAVANRRANLRVEIVAL